MARFATASFVLACALASACASGSVGSTGASSGDSGRPIVMSRDERRVIGEFNDVRGIAISRRSVFAVTSGGIAIYDRVFNTWERPFTGQAIMGGERITAMAADPVEDAVWFGTSGTLYVYRPQNDQLQRTIMLAAPDAIAFETGNANEAFVRANGEWSRVSRTGGVTPIGPRLPATVKFAAPSTLNDVYRKFPALRNQQLFLMREQLANRPLPQFTVTSGALSPDRASEAWLGTSTEGLWRVDPTFQQATALRFGLMERGVGSVAIAANGVWTGPLGAQRTRSGLTTATNDLQQWRWIEGTLSVPLIGVRSFDLSLRGSRAWMGTDHGLILTQLDGQSEMVAWSALDGLPSDVVYAVAAQENGAWAGTAAGLAYVSDSGAPNAAPRNTRTRGISRKLLQGNAVYALQPVGDTLWIGSNDGLYALNTTTGNLQRIENGDAAMRGPIRALAWSDSLLIIATDNEILRLSPRGNAAPTRVIALDPRPVGRVSAMAMDDRMIFLAGSEGLLAMPRPDHLGPSRMLSSSFDLPGAALDVAISRDWVWVATPNGLVRLSRNSDGGLP
ncbi:MAG: hypothetical protein ABJB66_13475 [Gemmatimonadaceae bacterium]